jgi:hypothetical protein
MAQSKLLLVVLASSTLLGACVREGSGTVPMRGGVDAARVHGSGPVPEVPHVTDDRRHAASGPSGDQAAALRRKSPPGHLRKFAAPA